jgi:hypothetical protein
MRIHVLSGLLLLGIGGCTIENLDKDDDESESGTGGTEASATGGKTSSGGSENSGASSGGRAAGTGGTDASATGGKTSSGGSENSGSGSGGRAAGTGGKDGGGEAGSGAGASDFAPSNIPAGVAGKGEADLTLTGKCEVDGKAGTIACDDGTPTEFSYELVVQSGPDRAELAVFSVRNLIVSTSAQVFVKGPYPVAFVAAETININGALLAAADGPVANAGGFDGAVEGQTAGQGPGAGGAADVGGMLGAGGGAFCGLGGSGIGASGPGMNGGKAYGNATLTPLIGGSSGGIGEFGRSGAGGGALQLVAGVSLNVGLTGTVSAPGGGGSGIRNAGGGSGGAVLLEAPSVRVAGTVTANGGGGSGGGSEAPGERGRVDGQAAKGGDSDNVGGEGSSSSEVDGGTARMIEDASYMGGAGGGAAGRIRINTASGEAEITGTLSPSLDTPCATIGTSAGG